MSSSVPARPRVTLLERSLNSPTDVASHAALTCYRGDTPSMGERINVEQALYESGHHTTLMMPADLLIQVEDISVSAITYGLHEIFPFYNTDQRSGRFCGEMFDNLDPSAFRERLNAYSYDGSAVDPVLIDEAIDFIEFGVEVFKSYKDKSTKLVGELLREERPRMNDAYIADNAHKIGQEQLRVFVSTVIPTGIDYKTNLVGLAALQRAAHTAELQDMIAQATFLMSQHAPDVAYMFKEPTYVVQSPALDEELREGELIWRKPRCVLKRHSAWPKGTPVPTQADMHPVDLLHADRRFAALATRNVESEIIVSTMGLGQKHRHRTVDRTAPTFTGGFYLPPVPDLLGLESQAVEFMEHWLYLVEIGGMDFAVRLTPYGAMVRYDESADFRAFIHEQNKRTCLCAQEEIYELSRQLREQLAGRSPNHLILSALAPRCFGGDMQCGEGRRYCRRDIQDQLGDKTYFPERRV